MIASYLNQTACIHFPCILLRIRSATSNHESLNIGALLQKGHVPATFPADERELNMCCVACSSFYILPHSQSLFKDDESDVESGLLSKEEEGGRKNKNVKDEDGGGGKHSPTISSMMEKRHSGMADQFGTLRFRCEYIKEHSELLVTLVGVLR